MKMRIPGVIFGLIVVVIGAALLFDAFDISGDYPMSDYWPVILIAIGFVGWVGKGLRPELGNMVLMSLGGILLTQNLVDDKSFVDLWPALAIAVALSIIFGSGRHKSRKKKFKMKFQKHGKRSDWGSWGNRNREMSGNDSDEFFSGSERKVDGEYTGSLARVKLAGGSLDLSKATLPEEGATLELDVMLGGYKIRVPNEWKIEFAADITMGEISDNRSDASEGERTGATLTIDGRVFMGGVEVSD
jgi:predicted membrane protein